MQTSISQVSLEEIQRQTEDLQKKIFSLVISQASDLPSAKDLEKECTSLEKFIELKRTEIVGPMNDMVKNVNGKAKELVAPIIQAKEDIRAKQIAFAQKIERERLEKEKEVLDAIQKVNTMMDEVDLELYADSVQLLDSRIQVAIETRRQFFAEQERLAEFARQQKIEQERLNKIKQEQGVEAARLEKELAEERLRKKNAEDEAARILEDGKRQEMKELADAEQKRTERLAEESKVKGLRKVVKFEVTDSSIVPLLYCSPDEFKIRDAVKQGVREIPGVRIYSEDKIQ